MIKLRKLNTSKVIELDNYIHDEEYVNQFINTLTNHSCTNSVVWQSIVSDGEIYLIGYETSFNEVREEAERMYQLYGYKIIE